MAKDVRTCRRCGRAFEEKRLKPYKMPTSDEGPAKRITALVSVGSTNLAQKNSP